MSRFFYRYPTFLKSILTSVYIAKYVPNGIGVNHNGSLDMALQMVEGHPNFGHTA